MREVKVTCPQCRQQDAYLQPEAGDYSDSGMIQIPQVNWKCPRCGYPDIAYNWTKWQDNNEYTWITYEVRHL